MTDEKKPDHIQVVGDWLSGDNFRGVDGTLFLTGRVADVDISASEHIAIRALLDEARSMREEIAYLKESAHTPPGDQALGGVSVLCFDDPLGTAALYTTVSALHGHDAVPRADHEREVREACIACVVGAEAAHAASLTITATGARTTIPGVPWWLAHVDHVLAERAKQKQGGGA